MAKLKNLLSEVFEDVQKVDKHKVSEGVRNFGIVGNHFTIIVILWKWLINLLK